MCVNIGQFRNSDIPPSLSASIWSIFHQVKTLTPWTSKAWLVSSVSSPHGSWRKQNADNLINNWCTMVGVFFKHVESDNQIKSDISWVESHPKFRNIEGRCAYVHIPAKDFHFSGCCVFHFWHRSLSWLRASLLRPCLRNISVRHRLNIGAIF